ncbi:hypothetical protein [Eisenbergiella tayi]|uniref:hypothetical protein n=1 Tax=Eisenbergiella tayi TaxID=1432052 RepID=UPI001FA7CBDF|nr:hypothetical protein [Eisenbergiella tayi]
MDTIETGGLHSDEKIFELGMAFQDGKYHEFYYFDTAGSVRDVLHVNETVGVQS